MDDLEKIQVDERFAIHVGCGGFIDTDIWPDVCSDCDE